jgi:hypothetical protein
VLRRLAIVCLLLGCLTACDAGASLIRDTNSPVDEYWLTEPANDADRLELLRRARHIDPCALLPHSVLKDIGTAVSIHHPGGTGCIATTAAAHPVTRARFGSLLLSAGTPAPPTVPRPP